ncbi:MAG TPA: phospho-N-acetylmuramoyl-pentapeptide-transferase [Tissierellaceae bacterium]
MLENTSSSLVLIISSLMAITLGPIIIPKLNNLGIGQSIRKEGPKSHLKKEGTPTMGGIIILLSIILSSIIFGKSLITKNIAIILVSILGFGLIGFVDDYLIVVRKDNQGLTESQKILFQTILAVIIAFVYSYNDELGTSLIIPFVKYKYLNLGWLYLPFMTFVIVGTVNSVNLTDGLDGLASGVTVIVMLFFSLIALQWGVKDIETITLIILGSCLGFLFHNFYPAKVFMGDTGSLALGGAVASIAMVLRLPLIIPIVGGIYLIEALSVIIQVLSFKIRKKRVFLMAPLHHHFEHKGWKETKVVQVFWFISGILAVIAYYALI